MRARSILRTAAVAAIVPATLPADLHPQDTSAA
jgi:hypothetical protein